MSESISIIVQSETFQELIQETRSQRPQLICHRITEFSSDTIMMGNRKLYWSF